MLSRSVREYLARPISEVIGHGIMVHMGQDAAVPLLTPEAFPMARAAITGQQVRDLMTFHAVTAAPDTKLLIPWQAVGLRAESEGATWTFDGLNCFFVAPNDAILRWCMEHLSVPPSVIRELKLRKDEAARRLLFHPQELGGVAFLSRDRLLGHTLSAPRGGGCSDVRFL
jgi:hypothetical protein